MFILNILLLHLLLLNRTDILLDFMSILIIGLRELPSVFLEFLYALLPILDCIHKGFFVLFKTERCRFKGFDLDLLLPDLIIPLVQRHDPLICGYLQVLVALRKARNLVL